MHIVKDLLLQRSWQHRSDLMHVEAAIDVEGEAHVPVHLRLEGARQLVKLGELGDLVERD